MENLDRHWFSDHLGAGKLMTWRHCKFRELKCSPLSFAVQFCTNSFSNSSFYRNTTWGCFKIRDTQMVNRSSQLLDLGAWKFWDTPGKLCPSYWDQLLSGLFARYESNQPISQPPMNHSSRRSNWSFGPSSRWCMRISFPRGGPWIQLEMGL